MNYFVIGLIFAMITYVWIGVKEWTPDEDIPQGLIKVGCSGIIFFAWPVVAPLVVLYLLGEALIKKFKKPEDDKHSRSGY